MEPPAGPLEISLVLGMDLQQAGMVSETEDIEGGDDPMVKYMQDHSRMAWILQQLEFNNSTIRNAFLKGEIIENPNSDMLACIEFVRQLVLPTHTKVPFAFISDLDRIKTVRKLIEGREELWSVPLFFSGEYESFFTWKKWIFNIGESEYWYNINKVKNSTPKSPSFPPNKPKEKEMNCSNESLNDPQNKPKENNMNASSDSLNNNFLKLAISTRPKTPKYNIKEESILDSDSHSSVSSDEESEPPIFKQKNISNNMHNTSVPLCYKEVTKPCVFELDGFQSIKKFFRNFETYFDQKFVDTNNGATQELKEFLPEELIQVYNIVGGPTIKYQKMKDHLMKWYKSQSKSTRDFRIEFYSSRMKSTETLSMYAMRLERLANRAFPDNIKNKQTELRHLFCKTVPSYFRRKMENLEDIRAIEKPNESKRLTWNERTRLAELEDRRNKNRLKEEEPEDDYNNNKIKSVNFTLTQPKPKQNFSLTNNSSVSQMKNNKQPFQKTYYKNNHNKFKNTYRFSANNNSNLATKPKYQHQNFTQPQPGKQLLNWTLIYCDWCGRRGHNEADCRLKLGSCVFCGNPNHELTNCDKKPFTPKCSRCGGTHLGKDCTLPVQKETLNSRALGQRE